MAAGGGAVQYFGVPGRAGGGAPPAPPAREAAHAAAAPAVHKPVEPPPASIAAPDTSMMELTAAGAAEHLPTIGHDGRMAMKVYAAPFDQTSRLPRVGLLMAGIGLNEAESDAAIRTLPGGVSLAVSPYGANLPRLLTAARAAGHEYLIAIPMEPAGYPLSDPGPSTLLVSASAEDNLRNLRWALSRIDGYAGATGVIGTMRGERLAGMSDQLDAVQSELSARGLLYIDPREGHGPLSKSWGRAVERLIDDPSDRITIDARLTELEQMAKDTRAALGLVMRPTPVAVARIAAWASGLADRGLILAPVSALSLAPAEAPVKVSERH